MKIHRRLLLFILSAAASGVYYHVAAATSNNLRGELSAAGIKAVLPGDPDYLADSAAYNLRYTLRPAAVTFPDSPKEVAEVVKIGAAYNYSVVARSGGHSYIANGLGGDHNGSLVVDLSAFKNITVNSSSGTAVIQPGNRLGDVVLALNDHGRALPHGTCPYVGIGGHSSFGGYGFTSRLWGLTLDTIQSLDVVLANGTIATISNEKYSDLFWAMRGAGPSFAITTSITVKTFPAPPSATVFQYGWNLNPSDAAHVISTFQTFVQTDLPQEFDAEFVLGKGNSEGTLSIGLTGGWYGPAASFNAVIAPFLGVVPAPSTTTLTVGTYINSVTYLGGKGTLNTTAPDNTDTFYVKSLMTPPMSDAALLAFMNYTAVPGFTSDLNWFVGVELWGGNNSAINNVPLNATAFGHRNSTWTMQFYASSPNFEPPYPTEGFTFLDGMVDSILNNSPRDWDYGAYPNYIDSRLQNWQQLYYASHYPRLQSIKKKYDPHNVFKFTESIEE